MGLFRHCLQKCTLLPSPVQFSIQLTSVLFSITLSFASALNAFEINTSNKTVQELSSAYSFLFGQQYLFDCVNKTKNNALLEEVVSFNHAFPAAQEKIKEALITKLGTDAVEKIETDLIPVFETQIKNSSFDLDELEAIKKIINGRINGDIPETILQPILYTTFANDPLQLITRGYSKKYTTLQHKKSKGITLEITLPKTWRNNEGNRPNVVQKWKNQNGNGPVTTMILIHDLGLDQTEKAMLKVLENDGASLSKLINKISANVTDDNDKEVEKIPIKIDQKHGMLITHSRTEKVLNKEVEAYFRRYMLLVDDKFVTFQCSGPKQELDAHYTLFNNICDVVANSIIFPAQYIQNSSISTLPTSSNDNET